MSAAAFLAAAEYAAKTLGPPVLEQLVKLLGNVDKSSDPLGDAMLAAQVTAAETGTVELLRLTLKRTARKPALRKGKP